MNCKVLPLIALLLAGCAISEKDSPLAPLQEGPDTTAVVLIWSQPRAATVEISRIEAGELVPFGTGTTPIERTLPLGSYAFRFTKEGYGAAHNAILLGPGAYETVGAELDTVLSPPPPAPRPTATLTVTPGTIVEGETVEIDVASNNAEFGFIAPVGIFSTSGLYTDEPSRTTVYTFAVFGPGGVTVVSATVDVLPRPAPDPWLTAEFQPDTVGVRQFGNLVWSCNADHIRIVGPRVNAGNRGAIGILPIRFDQTGTYRYPVTSYDASGSPVLTTEVAIVVIEEPTAPPDELVLPIPVNAGVTTMPDDQEETLVDLVALPPNVGVRVRAELEYSGDQTDQQNEAAAIGFRSGSSTIWATRDGEDCPVIPDQPGVSGRRWVAAGTVRGFTTGSIVFSHAIRHGCYDGRFVGRESIYASGLELVVTLQ